MLSILSKKPSLVLMLVSFFIVGCSNVDYVNRSSLKKMGLAKVSGSGSGKSFGAFALNSNSVGSSEDGSRLIVVGKHKSRIVAETMIHDRNDDKSLIKKSFVSAGAGSKKKGFMMQLRFEY